MARQPADRNNSAATVAVLLPRDLQRHEPAWWELSELGLRVRVDWAIDLMSRR